MVLQDLYVRSASTVLQSSQKEVQRYLRGEKIPLESPQFAPARGSPQYNLFEEFDVVDETFQDEFS
jgi:hypothetical protein